MFQRIMIFGRPGSGKSTFAHKLHKRTGLPLHHLDCHFWQAGWTKRNYEEFMNIQYELVEQDRWIIDGTQIKSLEVRYARADLCIYFNYPRWRCILRLFKRVLRKDYSIKDRAEGCYETLGKSFWTLLRYVWSFDERAIRPLQFLKQEYPQVLFVDVCSDQEVAKLLHWLGTNKRGF